MGAAPITAPDLSLAEAPPAAVYTVSRIHLGMVRDRCWSLGIQPGAAIHCRGHTSRGVVVELEDGRLVVLDASYARFVELATAGAEPVPAGGSARP